MFDFVGMLGLPLVPCHEFPAGAPAVFLSIHALKDPRLPERLGRIIASGKPVLLTDGLAAKLDGKVKLDGTNVRILPVKGDPKSLLNLPQAEADAIRRLLLGPLDSVRRRTTSRGSRSVGRIRASGSSTSDGLTGGTPAPRRPPITFVNSWNCSSQLKATSFRTGKSCPTPGACSGKEVGADDRPLLCGPTDRTPLSGSATTVSQAMRWKTAACWALRPLLAWVTVPRGSAPKMQA